MLTDEGQQGTTNIIETSQRFSVRRGNSHQTTGVIVVMQGKTTGQSQGIGAIVSRHQNPVMLRQVLQVLTERSEGIVNGDQHAITPLLITCSAWALPLRQRQMEWPD